MRYLTIVAASLALALVSGMVADALTRVRWIAVLLGFVVGTVTFALGTTKTALEIVEKWFDIRKKRRDLKNAETLIVKPTDQEISAYGGLKYRERIRRGRLAITDQERVEAKEFIVDSKEERSRGETV